MKPTTNTRQALASLQRALDHLNEFSHGDYSGAPPTPEQVRFLDTWVWAYIHSARESLEEAIR